MRILVCTVFLALLLYSANAFPLLKGLRRPSIKRKLIDECASFSQISNANPAKIQELAQKLERMTLLSAPASPANAHMLNGKWETLYTSLPMPRIDSLKALTYNALPTPQDAENTLSLDVDCFYQLVNTETNSYSNFVDFRTTSGGDEVTGVMSTLGKYSLGGLDAEERDKRLSIVFTDIFANPIPGGFRAASESDLIVPKTGDDISSLREAFNLKDEQALTNKFPPNYKSFSDITYLDEDLRLMRGQTGTLYVLRKI